MADNTDWIRKELSSHMQTEETKESVKDEEDYHSMSFGGKMAYIASSVLAMILGKVAYDMFMG